MGIAVQDDEKSVDYVSSAQNQTEFPIRYSHEGDDNDDDKEEEEVVASTDAWR